MKSVPLRLLALVPIPIVIGLVYWAVSRPMPPPLVLKKHGGEAGGGRAVKAVELPAAFKSGWKVQGKVEQYDKKTLFDRIDGAAPAYIRAGLRLLSRRRAAQAGDEGVGGRRHLRHGQPPQGLGMYATERDRSYTFIKLGEGGYLASGSLNFWKGRFYVKLAGFEDDEAMNVGLKELALEIAAVLPEGDAAALAPLALLPKDERLPNSDGYSHPALADVEGLEQVFFSEYKAGEGAYRVFVARCKDAAEAGKRLAQVKSYFTKDGAKLEESAAGSGKLIKAVGESATTLVLQVGPMLTGAVDLTEADVVPLAEKKLLAVLTGGTKAGAKSGSPARQRPRCRSPPSDAQEARQRRTQGGAAGSRPPAGDQARRRSGHGGRRGRGRHLRLLRPQGARTHPGRQGPHRPGPPREGARGHAEDGHRAGSRTRPGTWRPR